MLFITLLSPNLNMLFISLLSPTLNMLFMKVILASLLVCTLALNHDTYSPQEIACPQISPCSCYRNDEMNMQILCEGSRLFNVPDFTNLKTLNSTYKVNDINLMDNRLTNIGSRAFKGITPAEVPNKIDDGLTTVRQIHLQLRTNQIKTISPDAFDDLLGFDNIRLYLHLHGNKLTNLDFLTDPCRAEKITVYLNDNPLACDCHIYNLTRYGNMEMYGKCETPLEHRMKAIRWSPPTTDQSDDLQYFIYAAGAECEGAHVKKIKRHSCLCNKWIEYDRYDEEEQKCLQSRLTATNAGTNTAIFKFFHGRNQFVFGLFVIVYSVILH